MKICSRCGIENSDTAQVCKQCASPLQQAGGKTCPSGEHIMDPTWTECVYCKQKSAAAPGAGPARPSTVYEAPPRQAHDPTMVEGTPLPPRPPRPVGGPPSPPRGVAGQPPGRVRDKTIYVPPTTTPIPGAGQPALGAANRKPALGAANRKIVGMLITYSWVPEGKVYYIREGRNLIGRDEGCEVCVTEDQSMSSQNSHITYRQNFVVGDMVSMTGTDLDGAPIEEQFHRLGNYATIRAGSTYFTFIMVQPQNPATPAEPPKSGEPPL